MLDAKSKVGIITLKVDITKAFDTISWEFILKALSCFGFFDTFCSWIKTLLSSVAVSICFNGKLHHFFNCARGVRQGDPLSPLFFCLVEEVLSRCIISNVVIIGALDRIQASRCNWIPSHIMYADSIMLFFSGKLSNIKILKDIFSNYATPSDQHVNFAKSFICAGCNTVN